MNRALEELCINTIRMLSADAVQNANAGHPGMPLGAAAMAYSLWTQFLKHNPRNPQWFDRDGFVLSGGHGSILLYSLLYLSGYDLPLEEIKHFRKWGSKAAGHPERGLAPGVEVTTGPLGQGFGNGVGLAIAEAWLAARYNRPGHKIVDHYTYGICGDGDLMEGISQEAASIAGHLRLGKLIYLYDQNHISLAGATEDLLKWEQGLFGGKLLSAASLAKMTTPFKNNYAFGVGVDTSGAHKVISHGGGIEGFVTDLEYYPDDKITVVVLENVIGAATPGEIAKKLAAVAFGEKVQLISERKEITLDSKALGRYVGAYQMTPGPVMLITLEGNQLKSKLGNQQPIDIFPESETMFFLKVVDAQLEFPKDGSSSQVTLHQGGRDMIAKRLSEAEAKGITDAAAAFAKRFKDQTPATGGEAAVRKMISDLQAGKPDSNMMSANGPVRLQLSQLQSDAAQFGAIQSITFNAVGPAGPDIYLVKSEKGAWEYRIWLAPDGKVDNANIRPAN